MTKLAPLAEEFVCQRNLGIAVVRISQVMVSYQIQAVQLNRRYIPVPRAMIIVQKEQVRNFKKIVGIFMFVIAKFEKSSFLKIFFI